MQEENKNEMNANDYVEAVKSLKESSVPKEQFDKMVEENKTLMNAILNGNVATEKKDVQEIDVDDRINELRRDIFGRGLNNLEYWEKTLELRDLIKEQDPNNDIFVASNSQITPTDFDYQCAERVADVVSDCIEKCEGNSSVFTTLLLNRTKDINIPNRK